MPTLGLCTENVRTRLTTSIVHNRQRSRKLSRGPQPLSADDPTSPDCAIRRRLAPRRPSVNDNDAADPPERGQVQRVPSLPPYLRTSGIYDKLVQHTERARERSEGPGEVAPLPGRAQRKAREVVRRDAERLEGRAAPESSRRQEWEEPLVEVDVLEPGTDGVECGGEEVGGESASRKKRGSMRLRSRWVRTV